MDAFVAYSPLSVPKPFAPDVFVVDGPEVRLKTFGLTLPFPTRMTIVRLAGGDLWIHSPVAWSEPLGAALAALGPVRHLVAPSTLHVTHLADWRARYPDARSYGPAALVDRAVAVDEHLDAAPPAAWDGAFAQIRVVGAAMTEIDFFHHASRTLILTDLIENFEGHHIRSGWLRLLVRAAGAMHPDGKAPIDMQLSFLGRREALRDAVRRMIDWAPERIVLAHGRCYERDAVAELRRAFRWVL